MMSLRELDRTADTLPSSRRTLPMSKSLPLSRVGTDGRSSRDEVLHSSQSYSGRTSIMTYHNRQYPSASAALNDYISDFEQSQSSNSQPCPTYKRTVNDLLLPRTVLQRTVDRSLDTGVRDTKNEFHRFSVHKLIDESYEHMLSADVERERAPLASSPRLQRTSSALLLELPSGTERDASDLASEISSSTDALLLANPYPKSVHQKVEGPRHSFNRENPARARGGYPHPQSNYARKSTLKMDRGMSKMSMSNSRSFPRDRRQYTPAKTHSESPYSSGQRVSARRAQSTPRGDFQSRKSSQLSRSARRPVPEWVADLDASVASRKRLSSLYTDSLLIEDGHIPTHNIDSVRSIGDEVSQISSVSTLDRRRNPAYSTDADRAMSVMSATRPPPTWIEDLDTTTETLPGSLRLLVRDMVPSSSRTNMFLSNPREPSQKSQRTGYSNSNGNGFSKPSSLRSDIQRPTVLSGDQNLQKRHQNGASTVMESAVRTKTRHGLNSKEIRDRNPRLHTRSDSASTEDLINESPYGDGVTNFRSTTLSHSHVNEHNDRTPRNIAGSKSQHPVLKQPLQHTAPSSKPSHQYKGHQKLAASIRNSNPVKTQTHIQWETSTTTATDSLIYSSPFGLDRELRKQEDMAIGTNHLLPMNNDDTNGTMKEEEILTLSSLSSMTLQDDSQVEGGDRMVNNGDIVSESTVGETAKANAVLRRAHMVIENTQESMNVSSPFERLSDGTESTGTEELLAGNLDFMTKLQRKISRKDETSRNPESQRILDQFLDDCLQSTGKTSPESSVGQVSEGPLESLKNMLFKLQDMATQHTEEAGDSTNNQQARHHLSESNTKKASEDPSGSRPNPPQPSSHAQTTVASTQPALESSARSQRHTGSRPHPLQPSSHAGATATPTLPSPESSARSQRRFDEEPGGQSLQRAMKHLSRLKTLVAMDTASPSL